MATVLLLSDHDDQTAGRVAAEIAGRGVPIAWVDTGDFPTRLGMTAICDGGWHGSLTGDGGADVDLGDVTGVYYRRPTQFRLADGMSRPEQQFAYGEARRGFGGVIQGLAFTGCRWINDPVAAARAEYKPVQLAAASRRGLHVPETVISNEPERVHAWAMALGRPIVYKPLSGVWVPEQGQVKIIYTQVIEDPAEVLDHGIELTAHLFQAWVPKSHEARAIVIGEHVYVAAIHAKSSAAHIDWRSDYDALDYEMVTLPDDVEQGLIGLHCDLGLVYGAVDLACDNEGRWWFLETNPGGEWGWLADHAGIPVAHALADALTGRTPQ